MHGVDYICFSSEIWDGIRQQLYSNTVKLPPGNIIRKILRSADSWRRVAHFAKKIELSRWKCRMTGSSLNLKMQPQMQNGFSSLAPHSIREGRQLQLTPHRAVTINSVNNWNSPRSNTRAVYPRRGCGEGNEVLPGRSLASVSSITDPYPGCILFTKNKPTEQH